MRIVMLEALAVSEACMLKAASPLIEAGHEFIYTDRPLSPKEKRERIREAEVLIIGNAPLDKDIIEAAPKAKLLSVGFTGLDHVDLEACKAQGIMVCNAQGYATEATAELALGFMLEALRKIGEMDRKARSGGTKAGYRFRTLRGCSVGIVGTGAIGTRVAELCRAFGAKVLAYSRSERQAGRELGLEYVALEELLRRADIVSLHVPLTDETRALIGRKEIAAMKEGAILVNCARGGVVDSAALAEALNSGKLAAAGLDVLETEPPFPEEHPLLHARNVTITPHIGFFTEEAMAERAEIVVKNITAWLAGQPINVKA